MRTISSASRFDSRQLAETRQRGKGPPEHQARHLRRAWRRAGPVAFCHEIGLNYVSCSPYRVPIARLAAAQANLKDGGSNRDR